MMADYGIQPTGFVRKPLGVILAEIEAQNVTEFGPGIIQTSQSPLGQLNGLFADLTAKLWEMAEDVYQSYDPDQAEGTRLDTLGRLRILSRGTDELDADLRRAITNEGRARVDLQDLARAIRAIDGVTYSQVFVNDGNTIDDNGMAPNTVAVAVIGGDDAAIGSTMRTYIVPGISTSGNVSISTTIEGYCRTLQLVRPIAVPVTLAITIRTKKDNYGCPAPSSAAIRSALVDNIELINGEDVSWFKVRSVIESLFPNVEVVTIVGERDDDTYEPNATIPIAFIEIATIALEDVTVTIAP